MNEKELKRRNLKILQALPLEIKIEKTKQRIREWVQHWGINNVYVSYSAGKDSTVLLNIARQLYPEILAVYADTGLEYPELKEFVNNTDNVKVVRPKLSFKQVLDKYGIPIVSKDVSNVIEYAKKGSEWAIKRLEGLDTHGEYSEFKQRYIKYKPLKDTSFKISNKCCQALKKSPIKIYERETGRKAIVGTQAEESTTRKQHYLEKGCNSFEGKRPMSTPMGFWTEQDILKYIYDRDLEIPSVYGEIKQRDLLGKQFKTTGCKRTGCMFCLFGQHLVKEDEKSKLQRLKETHNDIYNYVLDNLKFKKYIDEVNDMIPNFEIRY